MAKNEVISSFIFVQHGQEITRTKKAMKMRLSGIANANTILGYSNYLNNGHGYLDYTSRESATINDKLDDVWQRDSFTISSDGRLYTNEEKKEFSKQMAQHFNTDGNLCWMPILSLKDYNIAETFALFNDDAYSQVVNDFLPKWFKSVNLEPDNIMWFCDYHNNTDNPHLHLCFLEKEQTRTRGKFTPTEMNNLRVYMVSTAKKRAREFGLIESDVKRSKELHESMDKAKSIVKESAIFNVDNSMKDLFKSNITDNELSKQLSKLFMKLDKNVKHGKLSYNSKNMAKYKTDVDKVTDLILSHPELNPLYNDLKEKWKELDIFAKGDFIDNSNSYINSESKKLYTLIGNHILKYKKEYDIYRNDIELEQRINGKAVSKNPTILNYTESRNYDIFYNRIDDYLSGFYTRTNMPSFDITINDDGLNAKFKEVMDYYFDLALPESNDYLILNLDDNTNAYNFEIKLNSVDIGNSKKYNINDIENHTTSQVYDFTKCLLNNLQDGKMTVEEAKKIMKDLAIQPSIFSFQSYLKDYIKANNSQPDNPYYREPKYFTKLDNWLRKPYENNASISNQSLISDVGKILRGIGRTRFGDEVNKSVAKFWQEEKNRIEAERDSEKKGITHDNNI